VIMTNQKNKIVSDDSHDHDISKLKAALFKQM
jgi:hypothetical protein